MKDFLDNNAYSHYYTRWYCDSNNSLYSEEKIQKIYNPYGYMSKIIGELILLFPILKTFNTTNKGKLDVLNNVYKQINWGELGSEVVETLEMKGDFFAYWYYDYSDIFVRGWKEIKVGGKIKYENPIPQIKVLESENMVDVIMDSNNKPSAYKYKEYYVDEKIDVATGLVSRFPYEVETIFQKGSIRVNDTYNYPEKGFTISLNKEWEADIIRLIHIPSFKKQKDKFSKIPATEYIDPILILDALTSDLRSINKLYGFPVAWSYDTDIDFDASSIMPGGKVQCTSTSDALTAGKQGYTKFSEIQNELKTIQDEQSLIDSVLYKKIGLIREKLEEKLGSTDSSRVISQLRLLLENKFEKYCNNIAYGMSNYFKSALYSTGKYTKTDIKNDVTYTFEMPDLYINTSIFDDLAITNTKLAIGLTTMMEEWDKQGMTTEEKNKRLKNINDEILMKNKDIQVSKEVDNIVKNGQESQMNLDNKLKQDTNLEVGNDNDA